MATNQYLSNYFPGNYLGDYWPSEGSGLSGSVVEAGSCVDIQSVTAIRAAALVEANASSDSTNASILASRSIEESANATDTSEVLTGIAAGISETASAQDTSSNLLTAAAEASEALSATSLQGSSAIFSASVSESSSASDSCVGRAGNEVYEEGSASDSCDSTVIPAPTPEVPQEQPSTAGGGGFALWRDGPEIKIKLYKEEDEQEQKAVEKTVTPAMSIDLVELYIKASAQVIQGYKTAPIARDNVSKASSISYASGSLRKNGRAVSFGKISAKSFVGKISCGNSQFNSKIVGSSTARIVGAATGKSTVSTLSSAKSSGMSSCFTEKQGVAAYQLAEGESITCFTEDQIQMLTAIASREFFSD
jgi:hypothetical protein